MKFRVIVADPPWSFSDQLTMSSVKRGSESQYLSSKDRKKSTLSIKELKELDIKSISEDDAVLALWCPSSLIPQGIELMKEWGFEFKQTHVWVKTKKQPLKSLLSDLKKNSILLALDRFSLNSVLYFGMGRLFRQTHEIVLLGTRGKIYNHLENKSQRSVHFGKSLKHSEKPDDLQNMLSIMFPFGNKLEMFARRTLDGWHCIGNQCPGTEGEDIKDSLEKLRGHDEDSVTRCKLQTDSVHLVSTDD
jgi:N6-adenosine-specific RNA methylase IME4